jgi:hypothetical protein
MNTNHLLHLKPKFVTKAVGEDLILVPLTCGVAQMDKLYILNETGKCIWEILDETPSLEEITNRLIERFDVDQTTAKKDIEDFIKVLDKLSIV